MLDLSHIGVAPATAKSDDDEPMVERNTTVEINGRRFGVKIWVPESSGTAAPSAKAKKPARSAAAAGGGAGGGSGKVEVPMQGTIVKVLVEVGQTVEAGQSVVVLEAMKMENQIEADKSGTVKAVNVKPGDTVGAGDVVVIIE